ncbi:MAG TPA: nucleoside transporter C-terminal domain-containing protein [Burkholderiales bacterium]|nr:nucleoside transporter C-terminal domain-containing protein [Burkholderiales bacterium]
MPLRLQSVVGLFILLAIAWAIGENRRALPWRIVLSGLVLQIVVAALLLRAPPFQQFFLGVNDALLALERATQAGTGLVFGYLGGAPLPYAQSGPGSTFVLAFRALPIILVVSALSSLLFYWRVLPAVVKVMSKLLEKSMGVGGAVGLSTAANVFIGMVEAPLVIRPYLAVLARGELFIVMTCGMAGIAGTVMVLYATILGPVIPAAMGHILAASLISAPAAIVVAALMIPPQGKPADATLDIAGGSRSSMDAIVRGTADGLGLLLNIAALLIVLVSLVTLANLVLSLLPAVGGAPVTLQRIFGYVMAPLVWLAGVPWSEAMTAGALMGTKTVLNELIAYFDMAALPADALSERSRIIMTYALCGFANFGSVGILVGGMTAMVPERRDEVLELGLKSLVSGTLATLVTAATAGLFL